VATEEKKGELGRHRLALEIKPLREFHEYKGAITRRQNVPEGGKVVRADGAKKLGGTALKAGRTAVRGDY